MKIWLEYIGDAVVIAFGLLSFMLFATILSNGAITLIEPSQAILITELILSLLSLAVGVERFIDDLFWR